MIDMKKPIMILSNDWHLAANNLDTVTRLISDKVQLAIELGLSEITVAGDLFDSRASQKLDLIMTFNGILDMVHEAGLKIRIIAGNHDKSNYSSTYSWIAPFRHHPAMILHSVYDTVEIAGFDVAFMPFIIEDRMVELLEKAEPANILISHFELNGSTNHGIVAKDRAITKQMLDKFDLTLLGHYHTGHEVAEGIIHMPSLYQRNFGEDFVKGYTVLYDDLSIEHIQSDFRPFNTIKIDVEQDTSDEVKEVLKMAKKDNTNIRVELVGGEEKVKAFKKEKLKQAGIDVKVKYDEIDFDEDGLSLPKLDEVKKMSSDEIKSSFDEFCEKEELNKEIGERYLEDALNEEG